MLKYRPSIDFPCSDVVNYERPHFRKITSLMVTSNLGLISEGNTTQECNSEPRLQTVHFGVVSCESNYFSMLQIEEQRKAGDKDPKSNVQWLCASSSDHITSSLPIPPLFAFTLHQCLVFSCLLVI